MYTFSELVKLYFDKLTYTLLQYVAITCISCIFETCKSHNDPTLFFLFLILNVDMAVSNLTLYIIFLTSQTHNISTSFVYVK